MKEITMYETDDGQIFRDKSSARFHEAEPKCYKNFKATVTLTQYFELSTRHFSVSELIDKIKKDVTAEYDCPGVSTCDVSVEVIDDG